MTLTSEERYALRVALTLRGVSEPQCSACAYFVRDFYPAGLYCKEFGEKRKLDDLCMRFQLASRRGRSRV